jgi:hypothetical protein
MQWHFLHLQSITKHILEVEEISQNYIVNIFIIRKTMSLVYNLNPLEATQNS